MPSVAAWPELSGSTAASSTDDGLSHRRTPITTLMFRNLPGFLKEDKLLHQLQELLESKDSIDFIYLPWDTAKKRNTGCCFINCRTEEEAARLLHLADGCSFWMKGSRTKCKVCVAHIQGLEENVRHLLDRAVTAGRFHCPNLVCHGVSLPLGQFMDAIHAQKAHAAFKDHDEPTGQPSLQIMLGGDQLQDLKLDPDLVERLSPLLDEKKDNVEQPAHVRGPHICTRSREALLLRKFDLAYGDKADASGGHDLADEPDVLEF
eukprot:CAMPEP_0197639280 /NCGR_PEP_ID=MMETSP1338-20131121/13946_1 /TAXON_ID=43686 ORGANISM="Pelagodinium beii, Strain RCC1491" /NCGR_SAMPLE_ID=MMETSP1338 /ASSEMBLY_ACC=CAM_ASM_000754 /LENGTH=261 /DNA_ID=CAMNT_0043211983 /DNA_START=105 /DNA_END=890 /DNA_ORIENTATION=-